jgi:hypothetical protein
MGCLGLASKVCSRHHLPPNQEPSYSNNQGYRDVYRGSRVVALSGSSKILSCLFKMLDSTLSKRVDRSRGGTWYGGDPRTWTTYCSQVVVNRIVGFPIHTQEDEMKALPVRKEVQDFIAAAETLLSPRLLGSQLTEDECQLVAEYLISMSQGNHQWSKALTVRLAS